MKRGHLIILFTFLFVLLVLSTLEREWQYEQAEAQKGKIDSALLFASDTAAEQLAEGYGESNVYRLLENAESEFFRALSAGMEVFDDFDKKEMLNFYVPLLIVTNTDGFYMNYLYEGEDNGAKTLTRIWSECQPYYYSDDEFIYRFFLNDEIYIIRKSNPEDIVKSTYQDIIANSSLMSQLASSRVFRSDADYREVKRASMAKSIETAAVRMINKHNAIAGQYGISMYYSVPSFLEDYTPAMEYPSFLAVFQGYPLSLRYSIFYNNCTSSAAYIAKVRKYTVELSTDIAQPYSVFHEEGCVKTGMYGTVLTERVPKETAISAYGAYACPHCFDADDNVPLLP